MKINGTSYLRPAIVLATLSCKEVIFQDIRSTETNPGINDYELNFIKLVQLITSGSVVEINETGTEFKYRPGIISNNNGIDIEFECGSERSISYYLEFIIPICIFGKFPIKLFMKGFTNDESDIGIDSFKIEILSIIKRLEIIGDFYINIKNRAFKPGIDGIVEVKLPIVNNIKQINWSKVGKIKRIRGIAFSCKTSPDLINRIIDTSRGIINNLLPDVWISSETNKIADTQGYGLSLVALSTNGFTLTTDIIFSKEFNTPEEIAREGCKRLLDEIRTFGSSSSWAQPLLLLLQTLTKDKEISISKSSRISSYSIGLMKLIKKFLNIKFTFEESIEKKENPEGEKEEEQKNRFFLIKNVGINLQNNSLQS